MDAERYIAIKEAAQRYTLLKEAVLNFRENDKEFFLAAFKKERFLDMKLTALRGYAEYASEKDVNVLMTKMLELLVKRGQTTPNDYQEYEPMRSPFLMGYLMKKYDYQSLKEFYEQLERQYDAMDDEWKGIFTLDEYGEPVQLKKVK